ncbi:MAG: thioredoxin domain-containing protein [bacterium]|nr:thioredoxin domain-containing protein [bacterium]
MDQERNPYLIPASIIVAGLLIAFAVVYTRPGLKFPSAPSGSEDDASFPPVFASCLDSGKHRKAVEAATEEGKNLGVNGTPATFINGRMISGAVPFSSFQEPIEAELASKNSTLPDALKIREDDFVLGNPSAKVAVIEYGDFQCPFCGKFFKTTEQQLKETYLKSGKTAFVWRDFAFLGEESFRAAEAARCAGEQGKFWEYHDYLFNNQRGENAGAFSDRSLKSFAATLGLD